MPTDSPRWFLTSHAETDSFVFATPDEHAARGAWSTYKGVRIIASVYKGRAHATVRRDGERRPLFATSAGSLPAVTRALAAAGWAR